MATVVGCRVLRVLGRESVGVGVGGGHGASVEGNAHNFGKVNEGLRWRRGPH